MTVTYTEPVRPLRDWLRTLEELDAAVYVVGQAGLPPEAFVNANTEGDLAGATIGVQRVGGGTDLTFDRPLIQFDCWTPRSGPATAAGALAAALCSVLEVPNLYGAVPLAGIWLLGADVQSNLPVSSTHPRHIVTADVTTQAR